MKSETKTVEVTSYSCDYCEKTSIHDYVIKECEKLHNCQHSNSHYSMKSSEDNDGYFEGVSITKVCDSCFQQIDYTFLDKCLNDEKTMEEIFNLVKVMNQNMFNKVKK